MQNMNILVDVQRKKFKSLLGENFLSSMWPQANPNPNRKLNPRVRIGVRIWNEMQNMNIVLDV